MSSAGDNMDEIKADIEHTRAQLAGTVDALTDRLDVKARATERAHELGHRAAEKAEQVKAAAPEPVQKAMDKAGQAAKPVLDKIVDRAAADKRRTALVVGGVLLAVLIARRVTSSRD